MNELSKAQIVAVVFCNLNQKTMEIKANESPYFYLDLLGCKEGDLALVHNSSDFGVVKVMRVIPSSEPSAAMRVTKPLLCKIVYDKEAIRDVSERLADFRNDTTDYRVQSAIDRILVEDKPVHQTRLQNLGDGNSIYRDVRNRLTGIDIVEEGNVGDGGYDSDD